MARRYTVGTRKEAGGKPGEKPDAKPRSLRARVREEKTGSIMDYVVENLKWAGGSVGVGILVGTPMYFASKYLPNVNYWISTALGAIGTDVGAIFYPSERRLAQFGEESSGQRAKERGVGTLIGVAAGFAIQYALLNYLLNQ